MSNMNLGFPLFVHCIPSSEIEVGMRIQRYASNLMAEITLVGCAQTIDIKDLPDIPDDEGLDAMAEISSVDAAPASIPRLHPMRLRRPTRAGMPVSAA
jgi:hypothetical protein